MKDDYLDKSTIESLVEIMGDDFSLLVSTFINDSTQRLEQLETLFEQGAAEEVRRVAHSLKGSASNIGAVRLSDFCSVVEQAAATGHLQQVEGAVKDIADQLKHVNSALESYL